jgi:hypothetical protein
MTGDALCEHVVVSVVADAVQSFAVVVAVLILCCVGWAMVGLRECWGCDLETVGIDCDICSLARTCCHCCLISRLSIALLLWVREWPVHWCLFLVIAGVVVLELELLLLPDLILHCCQIQ